MRVNNILEQAKKAFQTFKPLIYSLIVLSTLFVAAIVSAANDKFCC